LFEDQSKANNRAITPLLPAPRLAAADEHATPIKLLVNPQRIKIRVEVHCFGSGVVTFEDNV